MLYTMNPLMEKAVKEHYGIPAPNIFGVEMARAAIQAAEEMNAPLILDAGMSSHKDLEFFIPIVRHLCEVSRVPLAINLDHGKTYENGVLAIKAGYTSMMADRSKLPFEENAAQCAELCKMAHAVGMSFEAELGHVGFGSTTKSIEDVKSTFTRVDEAVEFVKRTDVDCLAVAVGTIHGHYPKGIKPDIQFGLIEEIRDAIKIPLVLHGCSGTGDENLAKAARLGVAKFNIGTENVEKGWAALEEALAKAAEEKGKPLGGMERYWVGEDAFLEGYKNSIKHYIEVLGCKDKA